MKELDKVRGTGKNCSECKDKLYFIPYGHITDCAERKCEKCYNKEQND